MSELVVTTCIFIKRSAKVQSLFSCSWTICSLLGIDFDKKKIKCVEKSSVYFSDHKDREHFELNYDVLVIGVGAKNNTFNVPGVDQYAFFLKVTPPDNYSFRRFTN